MKKWDEEMAVPAADQDYLSKSISRGSVPDTPGESDRLVLTVQSVGREQVKTKPPLPFL